MYQACEQMHLNAHLNVKYLNAHLNVKYLNAHSNASVKL